LTTGRLGEATEEILRPYRISMTAAHTLVPQACLGILLRLDMTITRDSLAKYPLAEYAGRHWVDHAQFKNVSEHTEEGLKHLLYQSKPHLSIWIWMFDPRNTASQSSRSWSIHRNYILDALIRN
jgi:hypothetical protein